VFFAPDKHLKVFERLVALCSVISEDYLFSVTLRLLRTFDSSYVTKMKPDSTRQDVGKANNTALFSVLRADARAKGTF
jgi:hypothetical protein